MSGFDQLADDTIREIAISLSLNDINKLCSVNQRFNKQIDRNETFWREKYIRDFSDDSTSYQGNWREHYMRAGTVWVCGYNSCRQLGLDMVGKHTYVNEFTRLPNLKVKQVSTGCRHTVFVDVENDVWVCGDNSGGRLGLGRECKNQSIPTRIPNFKAQQVSAAVHTVLIDLNNNVWVCGPNCNGRLGNGNNEDQFVPVQIPNIKAKQVSNGGTHTAMIDLDNNVWVCGYNSMGQLGLGGGPIRDMPEKIPDIDLLGKAKQVSVGDFYTMIIDSENNVWSCGFNSHGQLGLGDKSSRSTPTKIPNLKAQQVSAGDKHTIIIDLENDVWSWGGNRFGQLGLGDSLDRSTPTKIPNLKAKQISAGGAHTVIIDLENNVWGCGINNGRELSIKDSTSQYTPIQITNIKARRISAGSRCTMIIE